MELPAGLAEAARAAWNRDDSDTGEEDQIETDAERLVRRRAGSLALIGLVIEERAERHSTETVTVQLDAWHVGQALDAADDHGLITGPPPEQAILEPRFITTDIDIIGQPLQPLDALVDALSCEGAILNDHVRNNGERFVSVSLAAQHDTIESDLVAIAAVIDRLDPASRREWDAAASRTLNVGIEAGDERDQPVIVLDAALIATANALRAGLAFTHYSNHRRVASVRRTTII